MNYQMTQSQEVCNAISTVLPSIFITNLWSDNMVLESKIICLSVWCHMPVSFFYHMLCAFHYFEDPIDTFLRKLDQTMVHACCVTISYSLSQDVLYGISSFIMNSWYIGKLWIQGRHNTSLERRTNLALCIFLYLLPVLVHGDYTNYFSAFGSFITAVIVFHFNELFYGWGHSLQHVLYCPFIFYLIKASENKLCLKN